MTVEILNLVGSNLINQKFVELVREKLITQLGDHKWLVEVLNEQATPEEFNTNYADYATKFLCSRDCSCFGESDCDQDDCNCVFATEQVALRVQYNVKTGEVEASAIQSAVEQVRTEFGLNENFSFVKIKVLGRTYKKTNSVNSLMESLTALTGNGATEEELVKRVLFAVRDSLPYKNQTRTDLAKIANQWVKHNQK